MFEINQILESLYESPIITTPFGKIDSIYADSTASGQKLKLIDDIMSSKVYPYYANTHSNAYYGQLMIKYINDTKEIIKKSFGTNENDVIIMTGNGCTEGIKQLIHSLNLTESDQVFISKLEHFSNHLPWVESKANVVFIDFNENGIINTTQLDEELSKSQYKNKYISMSACSNVTGVIQPVTEICKIGHKYNCKVFFDYACSAPYVNINLHNLREKHDIDAIILSPHKMLGGAGTPGILIMNKELFKNKKPFCPGGSTVRYGDEHVHQYSNDITKKENGGTKNILGEIQLGLVLQVRNDLLPEIIKRNQVLTDYCRYKLNEMKNIIVLNGSFKCNQLPIFSFIIPDLHYNFVVALLNDKYGIQSRGGVSCSGLIAPYLLHLSKDECNKIYHKIELNKGVSGNYGWIRISFSYTMTSKKINKILDSIEEVSQTGYMDMVNYNYDKEKNLWFHKRQTPLPSLLDLTK